MLINEKIEANTLKPLLDHFLTLAKKKTASLDKEWNPEKGSPVFTIKGKYTSKGWTEWTQGFQFGMQILLFDALGEKKFFEMGRHNTIRYMAPHVSHIGVHDHGFNNISTYGNLRRLALEGKSGEGQESLDLYELAIKVSGAVQAARWTQILDGTGFIHSFNGPQSLFSDTIRSCRALLVSHKLGHVLMGENDTKISLLQRAMEHIQNTIQYNVYFGKGRDLYDVRGRVVHESIFNTNDGRYRCPSTQQGYSPFTTWTRGLGWVLLGCAEQLECFRTLSKETVDDANIQDRMLEAARVTANFFISNTPTDGVPYWDTGAPGLAQMPDHLNMPSRPDNPYEPVDSSAAAICAQGLLRLGHYLGLKNPEGQNYWRAGLVVAKTLLEPPYVSEDPTHQGLLLHSVYHRPNNWDYIPRGKQVPQGESSMWGDYHLMELAVYLKRFIEEEPYLTFWGNGKKKK